MKHIRTLMMAALLAAPLAQAKLPPPTPEELAAQQERRVQDEARLAKEKEQLEHAQDRVAERYRGSRTAQPAGGVKKEDLPQNTKQPPGGAPPEGGSRPSAEAHSAPAK
jgi:hypothetical protein